GRGRARSCPSRRRAGSRGPRKGARVSHASAESKAQRVAPKREAPPQRGLAVRQGLCRYFGEAPMSGASSSAGAGAAFLPFFFFFLSTAGAALAPSPSVALAGAASAGAPSAAAGAAPSAAGAAPSA